MRRAATALTRAPPRQANGMTEPRYGGAYVPSEPELQDVKEGIDKKCHAGCASAWDAYKKCAARIEEKGHGECAGWYMDYFRCLDTCAAKYTFKSLA